MATAQDSRANSTDVSSFNWAETTCEGTVLKLILAQAMAAPESIAVEADGRKTSYGELLRQTVQLASSIAQVGVKTDDLIGLLTERSTEAIVAMLAIHLAGAAYVPLDPGYPQDRLEYMLADAKVKILLMQKSLERRVTGYQGKVLFLNTAASTTEDYAAESFPTGPAGCENLAYVIYTSGTTGKPKGVMVEHRALLNLVKGVSELYDLKPGDRVLQFTSFSFDISVEEVFSCLAAGATLVLRPERMLESFVEFVDSCCRLKITVLNIPTAFWSSLTSALERRELARLAETIRLLIIGGEAANIQVLHRWKEKLGGKIRLLNAYGPTEATVTATVWDASEFLDESACIAMEHAPVGKPIPNVSAYVLDAHRAPVPEGTPGELYLGGAGVARGYLNRTTATQKSFIPDPFSDLPGARLYRTGDLAKRLPDGNLVCLGRTDHQVKIRGFRIELGEIEAALLRCPWVLETVVTVRNSNGTKQLAGYVVFKPGASQDLAELRSILEQSLPAYMVPAFLLKMPALPLTSNGKVDRDGLPDPCSLGTVAVPENNPFSDNERIVAQAIAHVLGIEATSPSADFLSLGGDSLKAMELVLELERHFQKQLSVRSIFDHPSIRDLAKSISTAEDLISSESYDSVDWTEKAPYLRREISWFVMKQWSCALYGTDPGSYSVSMALRIDGKLDFTNLELALNAVVKRHEPLRMVIPPASGFQTRRILWPLFRWMMRAPSLSRFLTQRMLQDLEADDRLPFIPMDSSGPLVLPEMNVRLDVKKISASCSQELDEVLLEAIREIQLQPFNLERGPLLRATLFQIAPEQHVLAVVLHHLVADGGAVQVFTRDLLAVYTALTQGTTPDWQPIQQSYSDYIHWLSNEPPTIRNYWKGRSIRPEMTDPLTLPFRRSVDPSPHSKCDEAFESVTVDEQTRSVLQAYAARQKCSLHTLLLSGLGVLCHLYTRQNRVPITVALAGRDSPATKQLVASLSTSPVLSVDCSEASCFETILHRVRNEMIEMLAHQQVSIGSMVFCELLRLANDRYYRISEDHPGVFFDYRPKNTISCAASSISVHEIPVLDPLWGDFEIVAIDGGTHLKIVFQYLRNRYDAQGMRLMAKDYLSLLTGLARGQDLRLESLDQLIHGPYRPDPANFL